MHAGVEQPPVEPLGLAPFLALGEFLAHEQEFLARPAPHEGVIGPEVGELLPVVAGHAAEDRAFAVHHFVVRQRQHKIFVKGIDETKGQIVLMMTAVHRIASHIGERVMHPAHIPFVLKAQPAVGDRSRDLRPRGGFLGHDHRPGAAGGDLCIGFANEGDGIEIFAPAVFIGYPLALAAAVIEIQHGGDSINAQTINTVPFEPEQRIGGQKIAHLVAAIVINQRIPIRMTALPRIGVLIEAGAVELRERMRVSRKMAGHPIEDHANPGGVKTPHQFGEAGGGTMPRGRRIEAGGLITPRAVERMLHHRQKFNVGKAGFLHIGEEAIGEFQPIQKTTVVVTAPGACMHFVNRHRTVTRRRWSRSAAAMFDRRCGTHA